MIMLPSMLVCKIVYPSLINQFLSIRGEIELFIFCIQYLIRHKLLKKIHYIIVTLYYVGSVVPKRNAKHS